jgi:hypothetical protein
MKGKPLPSAKPNKHNIARVFTALSLQGSYRTGRSETWRNCSLFVQ